MTKRLSCIMSGRDNPPDSKMGSEMCEKHRRYYASDDYKRAWQTHMRDRILQGEYPWDDLTVDQSQARAKLLEFGMDPAEVARKTRG